MWNDCSLFGVDWVGWGHFRRVLLKQQFIDIPARYHDRRITLRLILNPNWNILFIAIQNDLQNR